MATEKLCKFYRPSDRCGFGHCNLGIIWTICDGDVRFCENPDALIRDLYVEWGRGKKSGVKHEAQWEAKL